jgi:hypothetical protein
MTMTTTLPRHRTSRAVLVAAWAVPALVLGQFALLTGLPIAVVLAGSLRERRLRWWAGGLTALYGTLVALWLLGPSGAPSLSKFLDPVATALFATAGAVVAVAVSRRRAR